MENKVLEKNLTYISKYSKQLSDRILMTDIGKSNLQLANTESGDYNIVFNNIALHSNVSPQKEAQDISSNLNNNENNIIIVYGMGLGYLPDTIFQKCKKSKIIIYEPNLDLLKFVLSIAEIDALYQDNVFLSSSFDEFTSVLKKIITTDTELSICFLSSYKNLFYEDILKVFEIAKNILAEVIGNKNTFAFQMPIASCALLYNINKILQSARIEQLSGIYKGKTAIILCAGPSLEKNIEIIKNNQNKFVTFALSPTLKLLKKHNITPDFIISIDSINNLKHFDNIEVQNSYLIAEAFTFADVVNLQYKKVFFYISDGNFFNYWLRKHLKINNNLKTLGTSSYTALWSAVLMGFSKIILVGQDLAYSSGKCYAKGSQYECLECIYNKDKEKYEIIAPDFDTFIRAYKTKNEDETDIEQKAKNYLKTLNQNLRTTVDRNGKPIPTKADYLAFISLFEELAKDIKNIELINSSNGANINGFKNIELENIINPLENIDKLDLTEYKPEYDTAELKAQVNVLYKNLKNVKNKLNIYLDCANELIEELDSINNITDEIKELIRKYKDNFDTLIDEFKNEDINNLLSFCAFDIANILQSNYYSDITTFKNALIKFVPSFEKMNYFINCYMYCIYAINIR